MRRVAVTGLGLVSPLGRGREPFFDALARGQGGLRPVTRFETAGMDISWAGEVPEAAALVRDVSEELDCLSGGSRPFLSGSASLARTLERDIKIAFALAAAGEALADAALTRLDQASLVHLGVSLETFTLGAVGQVSGLDGREIEKLLNRASLRIPLDRAVNIIEARWGLAGLALTNCSACAAGLEA
ncbi:MAG: hypothetical protein LBK52_06470, partial [Deltaproteobacteria bacterium]|nr:hypothetical protein [Deltaproteobacteria bacterium]